MRASMVKFAIAEACIIAFLISTSCFSFSFSCDVRIINPSPSKVFYFYFYFYLNGLLSMSSRDKKKRFSLDHRSPSKVFLCMISTCEEWIKFFLTHQHMNESMIDSLLQNQVQIRSNDGSMCLFLTLYRLFNYHAVPHFILGRAEFQLGRDPLHFSWAQYLCRDRDPLQTYENIYAF